MRNYVEIFIGLSLFLSGALWSAPRVEFEKDTLPPLQESGKENEPPKEDQFTQFWLDTFTGPVTQRPAAQEENSSGPVWMDKEQKTLMKEILSYYQRVEVPEEGLKVLQDRGWTLERQIEYYEGHPTMFPYDAFRRIQYAKVHGLGLDSLEDLFKLQNAFRLKRKDPLERMVLDPSWIHFMYESNITKAAFPIHVVTLMKEDTSMVSLGTKAAMLPTALRWASVLKQRKPASIGAAEHRQCFRVSGGRFAGFYSSQRFGGPHKEGHADVDWWQDLFRQTQQEPRRVAFLVSVDSTMSQVDPKKMKGRSACERTRNLESFMQARWEGLQYALIPFSEGVLGLEPGEKVKFEQWRNGRRHMIQELSYWGCASRSNRMNQSWAQENLVKQIQNQVFGGKYFYGDSVVVFISGQDPHYTQWIDLSKRSGGIQTFASAQGILVATDLSLRAITR